jgi:hypothetical protein
VRPGRIRGICGRTLQIYPPPPISGPQKRTAAVTLVRVAQGSEPAHFCRLFNGGLVVHRGGAQGQAAALAAGSARLYHVKGTSPADTRTFEVEAATATSLNSGDCFVLAAGGADGCSVYLWAGKGTNDAERAAAGECLVRIAADEAAATRCRVYHRQSEIDKARPARTCETTPFHLLAPLADVVAPILAGTFGAVNGAHVEEGSEPDEFWAALGGE